MIWGKEFDAVECKVYKIPVEDNSYSKTVTVNMKLKYGESLSWDDEVKRVASLISDIISGAKYNNKL